MISVGLLLLSLFASSFAQENDWRKPCLDGVCYYDLPRSTSQGGPAGTIKIWGSSEAITDITPAAGWEIIDCKKDALTQKIRLVCTGDAKCRHLFGRRGAKGKIVRLPESCGKNAFAHIKAARPSLNRSIPSAIAAKIIRRDVEPDIQELDIDTDFSKTDNTDGNVYFSVIGTNTQTVSEEEVKNELEPRGWDVDKSHTIPLFSYHNAFTLVDQSLTCGAINGNFRIGGNIDADFTVTIGITAEGSFFPPDVDSFKAYAMLNGAVSGAIDLSAGLSGSWSTGRLTLFERMIGGIDFAGIISVGPSIAIATSVDANFGISANIHAGFNWQLVNAQVYFPGNAGQSGPGFELGTAPLQLTITPTASATASVVAHIIPIVALKIEALGVADARVYIDVDASARAVADVSVSGAGGITVPIPKREVQSIEERQFTYTWGGCIDVDAGIDVNFGADAKFFGIFEKNKVIDLYTKNWDLYNKCFGDRARTVEARRSSWARSINESTNVFKRDIEQRGLSCTINNNNASPVTVINTNTNGLGAVPK